MTHELWNKVVEGGDFRRMRATKKPKDGHHPSAENAHERWPGSRVLLSTNLVAEEISAILQ